LFRNSTDENTAENETDNDAPVMDCEDNSASEEEVPVSLKKRSSTRLRNLKKQQENLAEESSKRKRAEERADDDREPWDGLSSIGSDRCRESTPREDDEDSSLSSCDEVDDGNMDNLARQCADVYRSRAKAKYSKVQATKQGSQSESDGSAEEESGDIDAATERSISGDQDSSSEVGTSEGEKEEWYKQHEHIGAVVDAPLDHEMYSTPQLEDCELSMLLLIHKCDQYGLPRKFLDELLDIIQHEMQHRNFNPATAPSRKTVVKKVTKKYGSNRKPEAVRLRLHDAASLDTRDRDAILYCKFCIKQAILDLINVKRIFGDLNNLVVNKTDRWKLYTSDPNLRDEILDGTWFRSYVRKIVGEGFDEALEFVIPLIIYVDKTGTDINQRYPLEPLIFTFAIIARHLRMHSFAWRMAAFLPELEGKSRASKAAANRKNPGNNSARYHLCLGHMFTAFGEVEHEGIVDWCRLGDQAKYCRMKFPIAYVINDGKSKDNLLNRKTSYTKCARISAVCKTPQDQCDDPTYKCKYLSAMEIHELAAAATNDVNAKLEEEVFRLLKEEGKRPGEDTAREKEIRKRLKKDELPKWKKVVNDAKDKLDKKLTAYPILNGIIEGGVTFGGDDRGLFGASPTDLMHAFQSGIIPYLVKIVIAGLQPEQKRKLDELVDDLLGSVRNGEKKYYPKCSFSKQFSNLTLLTSDEWPGMLFTLLLVLRTDRGAAIFSNQFGSGDLDRDTSFLLRSFFAGEKRKERAVSDRDTARYANLARTLDQSATSKKSSAQQVEGEDEDEDDGAADDREEVLGRKCSMSDFILLAEAMLSFHAWYKLGFPCTEWNKNNVDSAVRRLLAMLKLYLPRVSGNGWKIQKFHDLLHLALDIDRFGDPANFDAGPGESMLRIFAKLVAKTAQKRGYFTFLLQTASRAHEFETIQKAMAENYLLDDIDEAIHRHKRRKLEDHQCTFGEVLVNDVGEPVQKSHEPEIGGSHYFVFKDQQLPTVWSGDEHLNKGYDSRRKGHVAASPVLEAYLRGGLGEATCCNTPEAEESPYIPPEEGREYSRSRLAEDRIYWKCYTECKQWTNDGLITFRSHPNYHNEGPVSDWAMVHFEENGRRRRRPVGLHGYPPDLYPCKILCFLEHPVTKEVHAVVHACQFRQDKDVQSLDTCLTSVWFTEWQQEKTNRVAQFVPRLRVVKAKALANRCFVIEEHRSLMENIRHVRDCKDRDGKLLTNKAPATGSNNHNIPPDTSINSVLLVKKRGLWAREFV